MRSCLLSLFSLFLPQQQEARMKNLGTNVYNFPRCFSQFSRHIMKPNFVAYFPNHFIRRYGNGEASRSGHGHGDKERAPSTAETFERVAQEKEKKKKVIQEKAQKGVTSQTIDKAEDAFEEATIGESSDLQTVKQRYKED